MGVYLVTLAIVAFRVDQLEIASFVSSPIAERNLVVDMMLAIGELLLAQGAYPFLLLVELLDHMDEPELARIRCDLLENLRAFDDRGPEFVVSLSRKLMGSMSQCFRP